MLLVSPLLVPCGRPWVQTLFIRRASAEPLGHVRLIATICRRHETGLLGICIKLHGILSYALYLLLVAHIANKDHNAWHVTTAAALSLVVGANKLCIIQ